MLLIKKDTCQPIKTKHKYYLSAVLLSPLRPGQCASYIYNGNVFRTAVVKNILEAATDYVRFETRHSVYTIGYIRHDNEHQKMSS